MKFRFVLKIYTTVLLLLLTSGQITLANETVVYPPTSGITFDYRYNADTVTITIINNGSLPIDNFYLTDITYYRPSLINCYVDGHQKTDMVIDNVYGSIYSDKLTTRWVIGSFYNTVTIKYHVSSYFPGFISWAGDETGDPVFGLIYSDPGVCCIGDKGNIDGSSDDKVEITDLVYFVNHMFSSPAGPPPYCTEEADMQDDDLINIADLVVLVNYMFSAEHPPLGVCP